MSTAVAYLESPEYVGNAWRRSVPGPPIEVRGLFESDLNDNPDVHDDLLCEKYESLCTGDGFRWSPALPVVRFA